ncbi:hypothetical protein TSMEX_006062 [Taenia solium]|eukprot:TsM_000935300 transcript=TsM_000935300 gene=TsM_000935300
MAKGLGKGRKEGIFLEGRVAILSENGPRKMQTSNRNTEELQTQTILQLIWTNVKQQLRSQFNCVEESARTSFPAIGALITATQSLVQRALSPFDTPMWYMIAKVGDAVKAP